MLDNRVLILLSCIGVILGTIGNLSDRTTNTKRGALIALLQLAIPTLIGIFPGILLTILVRNTILDPLYRHILHYGIAFGGLAGLFNGMYYLEADSFTKAITPFSRLYILLKRSTGGFILGTASGLLVGLILGESVADSFDTAVVVGAVGIVSGAAWQFINWEPQLKWPQLTLIQAIGTIMHKLRLQLGYALIIGGITGFVDELLDIRLFTIMKDCFYTSSSCQISLPVTNIVVQRLLQSTLLFAGLGILMWSLWIVFEVLYPQLWHWLSTKPFLRRLGTALLCAIYVDALINVTNLIGRKEIAAWATFAITSVALGIGGYLGGILEITFPNPENPPPFSLYDIPILMTLFFLTIGVYIIGANSVEGLLDTPEATTTSVIDIWAYLNALILFAVPIALVVGGCSRNLFWWSKSKKITGSIPPIIIIIGAICDLIGYIPSLLGK